MRYIYWVHLEHKVCIDGIRISDLYVFDDRLHCQAAMCLA